jgi:plasmid stabilization system protein ParE
MKPLIVHADAEHEFRAAMDNYEKQRIGLGSRFRTAVESAIERIRHAPEMYAEDDLGARACTVKRFPYTVYYLDLDERIWIVAIAHQHRKPGYWTQRVVE